MHPCSLAVVHITGVCSRRVADSVFSCERDTRQLLGKLAEKI